MSRHRPHRCDDHAWAGWGLCSDCGAPRVCCSVCMEDLTRHHGGCKAAPY